MPDAVITILLGYAFASFLLTAIFVSLNAQSRLAEKIRRHFYWFPLMPPILLVRGLSQIVAWTLRVMMNVLRYCFETLSGKKTYRRQRINRYYND